MNPFCCTKILAGLLLICVNLPAAANAQKWITLESGDAELFARAGAVQTANNWRWTADGGFRIGLPGRLELATPLALSFAPLRQRSFEIALTAGVTDFWPLSVRQYLYTPAVAVSARAHLSHEATALFAIDFTLVQENTKQSPGFIRGGGALMVDMGPWLTWCFGVSYQHIVVNRGADGPLPPEFSRSGLAGKERVSIGSVRVTPYSDVPLFSIHAHKQLDITINGRFDIDADHTSTRLEGGFLIKW